MAYSQGSVKCNIEEYESDPFWVMGRNRKFFEAGFEEISVGPEVGLKAREGWHLDMLNHLPFILSILQYPIKNNKIININK